MSALNHWMLHTDAQAREYEATLALSPAYDSVRQADPLLLFLAPFSSGLQAFIGPDSGLWRGSVASMATAIMGRLAQRDWHVARSEYEAQAARGLLLEAARTNKCLNFNAAPDAALTGLTLAGDPAATLSRTLDAAALKSAGLELICPSGYVFVLDNRSGAASASVAIAGQTGNTIIHTASLYWRGEGRAELRINGGAQAWQNLQPAYGRWQFSEVPDLATRTMELHVDAGGLCYWVLNQFEENWRVASSVIETLAVATSRATDQVRWMSKNEFGELLLSHEQGMFACNVTWQVVSGGAENPGGYTHLLHPITSEEFTTPQNQILLVTHFHDNPSQASTRYERSDNSHAYLIQNMPIFPPRQPFSFALRWNRTGAVIEQGILADGVWQWRSAADYHQFAANDYQPPYYGATFGSVPGHLSNVRHWSEDRGRAWLEANV